jgi:hypothetical protein
VVLATCLVDPGSDPMPADTGRDDATTTVSATPAATRIDPRIQRPAGSPTMLLTTGARAVVA